MEASTPRKRGRSQLTGRGGNSKDDILDEKMSPQLPVPTSDQTPPLHREIECLPLTWNEARSRLRHTMEKWKSERRKQQKSGVDTSNGSAKGSRSKTMSVDDPDILFLAIPLSLVLAVLQFVLPHSVDTRNKFSKMQRAGALLFTICSITSAWIAWRRRKVTRFTDKSIERRRCVSAFLEGMKARQVGKSESKKKTGKSDSQHRLSQQSHTASLIDDLTGFNVNSVPRKNVEDVYSTYRLDDDEEGSGPEGEWHRIPVLLLVAGDFIALKVGDIAPAMCTAVKTFNHGHANDGTRSVIGAGERVAINTLPPSSRDSLGLDTIPALTSLESTITLQTSNVTKTPKSKRRGVLQAGRSTLTYHSEEMLLLANGVQIFALLETPLESFLRKESVKMNDSTPQVLRQGEAVRCILQIFSIVAIVSTGCVLLLRPGGAENFFQNPTWTLPLLAALGVLPVSTPVFLFWVECCGVSRILATVHHFASKQNQPKVEPEGIQNNVRSSGDYSTVEHRGLESPSLWLVCRYLMTTSTHRLFRKSLVKKISSWFHLSEKQCPSSSSADSLLSIPPASLHLLEKLGVVTALALVDDELACEPHSSPQQLLIPSGSGQGGFTLLDICPVCYSTDDGESEEKDANPPSRRQSSVSFDSDDSNEDVRFVHSFSAPRRTLRKFATNYRKKNYLDIRRRQSGAYQGSGQVSGFSTGVGSDDRGDQFEFEDPEWWTYLPSLKAIGLACLMVEERTQPKKRQNFEAYDERARTNSQFPKVAFRFGESSQSDGDQSRSLSPVETSLIDHICCDERKRKQLQLLAQCIGFETFPNTFGPRGDLSSFHERRRLHILSTNLLRQRMQLDSHALGLEESRNWSRLFTDADTLFVRDERSGGDLVLTVGDARVVTVSYELPSIQ